MRVKWPRARMFAESFRVIMTHLSQFINHRDEAIRHTKVEITSAYGSACFKASLGAEKDEALHT